jgi:predicted ATPase
VSDISNDRVAMGIVVRCGEKARMPLGATSNTNPTNLLQGNFFRRSCLPPLKFALALLFKNTISINRLAI